MCTLLKTIYACVVVECSNLFDYWEWIVSCCSVWSSSQLSFWSWWCNLVFPLNWFVCLAKTVSVVLVDKYPSYPFGLSKLFVLFVYGSNRECINLWDYITMMNLALHSTLSSIWELVDESWDDKNTHTLQYTENYRDKNMYVKWKRESLFVSLSFVVDELAQPWERTIN